MNGCLLPGGRAGGFARLAPLVLGLALALLAGLAVVRADPAAPSRPASPTQLVIATTTSTVDTGLLDVLDRAFQDREHCTVKVIAKGTGAALQTAQAGDVDLVLVHAPEAERAFMQAGWGVMRRQVMYNDFVLVGPAADPAKVKGMRNAARALAAIARAGAVGKAEFISRGDNSGTHMKEKTLWSAAKVVPRGAWYMFSGQGMGDTLSMASERRAYTLSDRATFLKWSRKPQFELKVMVEGPVKGGDARLINVYSVILVNPQRYPERNFALARKYADFITSPEGQAIIGKFTIAGQVVFHPSAAHPIGPAPDGQ